MLIFAVDKEYARKEIGTVLGPINFMRKSSVKTG